MPVCANSAPEPFKVVAVFKTGSREADGVAYGALGDVQKINRTVVAYAEKPEVLAKLKQTGYKPRFTTPEENVAALTRQIGSYRDVIERAKIKLN